MGQPRVKVMGGGHGLTSNLLLGADLLLGGGHSLLNIDFSKKVLENEYKIRKKFTIFRNYF